VDAEIELRIEDDGRGVDLERVRARAVELGLLEEPPTSDEQLLELIFHPAFSTRDGASPVSGRGVGLDAARTAMTQIGGSLSVTTAAGWGTCFVARAPSAPERVRVHVLRAASAPLFFAVDASWSVARTPGTARCITEILDLPRRAASQRAAVTLGRGSLAVALAAEGVGPGVAQRAAPTGATEPVEIVRLEEGDEALLVRPDALPATDGARGSERR
jgi:hypothetical protein